jgi:hypothetical protein
MEPLKQATVRVERIVSLLGTCPNAHTGENQMAVKDKSPIYWMGTVDKCDICHRKLTKQFVDGKTAMGPWAKMHVKCHSDHGLGFGTGLGQRYEQQANKRWLRVEG